MTATISVVLRNLVKTLGFKSPHQFAVKHGFSTTSFNSWYNGESAPRSIKYRQKLLELTGHYIFAGGLTPEKKRQSLAPAVSHQNINERANRLTNLVKAVLPDLKAVVIDGDVDIRNNIRENIGEQSLADFSVFVRAFSSEDSLELLKESSQLNSSTEGGDHADTN